MIPDSCMQYIPHRSCNILLLVNLLFAQSRHYKHLVPGCHRNFIVIALTVGYSS